MKKIYAVFLACFCISFTNLFSQNTFPSNGSVGIGTTSPNASSILEIKSTSKGVLVPRMTMAQRNAIVSPAQSLIVFQTDSPSGFYYYDGGWKSMSTLGYFATTKLDNLDANTAASQNILPNSNNAKDLGSSSYSWRNLYVAGIGYLTAAQLGNYTGTPQAGMLRWTGTAFQGYNGSAWITLSGSTTYTAGTGISISGNTITNTLPDQTVKITGAGATTVSGTYPNFTVSSTDNDKQTLSVSGSNLSISNGNTVAIPQTTYTAGNGISISGTTITNSAQDKTVSLTGTGATTVSGTYPNFTINSTDNNTTYIAGNGLSLTGNVFANTAPDQTVSLTGSGATTVTGTYPNFTVSSTDAQTLALNGNNLSISNGNSVTLPQSTDAQTLSVSGNNLSISNGNTVAIPQATYTAGTGINITGTTITNTAPTQWNTNNNDISYTNGNVGIGTSIPAYKLDVNGDINISTENVFRMNGTTILKMDNDNNNGSSFVGSDAGNRNMGDMNAGLGYQSLYSNELGGANTALGYQSLYSNTFGGDNTAVGYQSLYSSTGSPPTNFAEANSAIGYQSLYNNKYGSYNAANGYQALYFNINGFDNTANGSQALYNNTDGNDNTASGYNALYSNSIGYSNIAIGTNALYTNTEGHNLVAVGDSALFNQDINPDGNYANTAIGSKALYSNTTGYSNVAIGTGALSNNINDYELVAVGDSALYSLKSARSFSDGNQKDVSHQILTTSNTAIGSKTLFSNTQGFSNTAIGYHVLYSNMNGSCNTANGDSSLYSNTAGSNNIATGFQALSSNTTGSHNIAIGAATLYTNVDGNDIVALGDSALFNSYAGANVGVGSHALYSNSTGNNNTATGYQSLYDNGVINGKGSNLDKGVPIGYGNTANGYQSLYSNMVGNNNTALGCSADVNSGSYSNTTVIGCSATGTASNQVRVGDDNVTSIGGYTGWTNISDGRAKKNIKANVPGLAFINLLKPITYNLDLDAADKIIQRPAVKDKDGKIMQPSQQESQARTAKMQILYTGFIAQDVEKAAKNLNYEFSGVDAPKNDKDLYGLRYAEFVVPLVKAVQELSKQNDNKDAKIDTLQNMINSLQSENDDLKKQFADLKTIILHVQQVQQQCSPCSAASSASTTSVSTQLVAVSSASLEQNIPNPFSNATSISYTLPQTYSSAKIIITDKLGKTLKEINVSGSGKGSVNVDASTLSNGAYQYSLYVNNKLIDTKQMISQK